MSYDARFDAVLAPSYAAAQRWNIEKASEANAGLFGVIAEPFDSWVAKMWELYGDGRGLVSSVERLVVAEAVISRHAFKDLSRTPGLANTLATCARDGFGVPVFEQAMRAARRGAAEDGAQKVAAQSGLTPAEREFLGCIGDYASELARNGLIEQGQALATLAGTIDEVLRRRLDVLYIDGAPLSAQMEAFFSQADSICLSHDVDPLPARLGKADVAHLRFAFPTGRYAQPALVLEAIRDCLALSESATVVVSSARPLELYERIAPALTDAGITCSVQASKPFAQTDIGRAFLSACRVRERDMPWDKDALASVLHSSFVGFAKDVVWRRDAAMRKDRIASKEAVMAGLLESPGERGLSAQQHAVKSVLEAAADPFARHILESAEEQLALLGSRGCAQAYIGEQRMAIQALADASVKLEAVGAGDVALLLNVLDQLGMQVAMANYEQRAGDVPQVQVMTLNAASQLPARSASALIACDLTTASYPLGSRASASESLLERLGAGDVDSALAKARRSFSSLMNVPAQMLVLERSLNDEQADPLYPSAMWEEFVDAYREGDLSARDDIDNRYRLPERLQAGLYELGEEDLMADLRPGRDEGRLLASKDSAWDRADAGRLAERIGIHGKLASDSGMPRLSASQIETYLDCPYQWFIVRRLGATDIDEGFGPDKVGSFYHALFQRFYIAFGEKVTSGNLQRALDVMFGEDGDSGLFGQLVGEQALKAPGERLVAIPGTTEQAEVLDLRNRVEQWLAFETGFLRGFVPVAFECAIDDVEYEGALIRGSIDRIDVNERGQAVVIDYKGSIKDEHKAFRREGRKGDSPGAFMDNGKVQAALYSDLLSRAGSVWSGLVADDDGGFIRKSGIGAPPASVREARIWPVSSVVGALYVSYNRGNKVSGAYSAAAISGSADIPTLDKKTMSGLPAAGFDHTFEDFIEFNRNRAKRAVDAIRAGMVEPSPSGKQACRYCPVHACEKRSEDESY